MSKSILISVLIFASTSCFAENSHWIVGVNYVSYTRPIDNVWYDAPYRNTRTVRNVGITLGIETELTNDFYFKIGYFKPRTHYVNSEVTADTPPGTGGYCMQNCGPLGTIAVATRTQGVFFLLSPQYGDRIKIFADIGGWIFHQTVEAAGDHIPGGKNGMTPTYWHSASSANAIRKILGFGVKYDGWMISFDRYGVNANSKALPAGFNGTINVLMVAKEF